MEVDESNDVIIKMIIKLFRQTIEAVPLQYFDCKGVLCMKQHWPRAVSIIYSFLLMAVMTRERNKPTTVRADFCHKGRFQSLNTKRIAQKQYRFWGTPGRN